jgi:hypothetical protein
MTIRTADDWWDACLARWDDIVSIFENCGAPLGSHEWSEGIGKDAEWHDKVFLAFLTDLRDHRDGPELARWFNLCWIAAPDKSYIHSWPGWGTFCDLCSETWVFEPEEAMAQ